MKLDEIFDVWKDDSQFDRTELGEESLKTPQLHHKYYKMFSHERLALRKLESEYKTLYRDKYEYYQGILDQDSLQEYGWEPFQMKLLRTDIPQYIDADRDVINLNLRIAMQKEKIDVLESIIKTIQTRGFAIKNALDWERFKTGM